MSNGTNFLSVSDHAKLDKLNDGTANNLDSKIISFSSYSSRNPYAF